MFRKSLMLCASLLFVGCGEALENEFREGIPSAETVKVEDPGGTNGQKLETDSVRALDQGQTSDFYKLTRGASITINGGTAAMLNLVEEVTEFPPTSIEGDVAVWGPHTDALSPTTWKLTVTKTAEHAYSYKLEGKAKTAADTEFQVILSGSHTISLDAQGNRLRNYGSGTMKIDWDAAQKMPEHGDEVGTADIRYSRVSAESSASVEADFRNVNDDDRPGTRVNADYRYKEVPGAGGEFDLALDKNFDNDGIRNRIEHLTVKTRWAQNGAGRSDVKITGGDFNIAAATVSECWDSNFASQYLEASWVAGPVYGSVAACGGFSAAVYSSL